VADRGDNGGAAARGGARSGERWPQRGAWWVHGRWDDTPELLS